jgi:hypothetical protein
VWTSTEIAVEIEDAEDRTMIATVRTPVGELKVIAEVQLVAGVLWARNVHVQGLSPSALGRAGLNAVARKFLEEADAEALVVEGAARTTGANPHRRPRTFRYPR